MDIQKVTADYRLAKWAQVVKARHESGQKVDDFCAASGISKNAYYYWQRKLKKAACTGLSKVEEAESAMPNGWLKLNTAEPLQAESRIAIEVNGCHITVTDKTDPQLLINTCRILRGL